MCFKHKGDSTRTGKRPGWWASGCGVECLLQIGRNVVDVFDSDRQADEVRCDPASGLLFRSELAVGCGGRVDGEAFCIADIGQMAKEAE